MTRKWMNGFVVTGAVVMLGAAQQTVSSFTELAQLVQPGAAVTVALGTGSEITGTIGALSSSRLALLIDGRERELREGEIFAINQDISDSPINGGLLGGGWSAGR